MLGGYGRGMLRKGRPGVRRRGRDGSVGEHTEGDAVNIHNRGDLPQLFCKTGGEGTTSASVMGEGCTRGTRSSSSMRALRRPVSSLKSPISLSLAVNRSKSRSIIGLEDCLFGEISLTLSSELLALLSFCVLEVRFVLSISPTPSISHSTFTSGYVAKNFVITSSVIPVLLSKVPRETPILV